MRHEPNYPEILNKEDFALVRRVFGEVWEKTDKIRYGFGLLESTVVSEIILRDIVINFITDIKRLQDFHKIEEINLQKFWGYLIFWYSRQKPVQIRGKHDAESNRNLIHYINEFIIVTMFSKEMLEKRGIHWNNVSNEQQDFFKLLLYNLRYRNFTAQSLELAFTGFCCG